MTLLQRRILKETLQPPGTPEATQGSLAILGNGSGIVSTGVGNRVYIRMLSTGQLETAVNYNFPNENGRLVRIGFINGKLTVTEMLSPYDEADAVVRIPPHDHSFYAASGNVTWVYPPQFMPLTVLPNTGSGSFVVRVYSSVAKPNSTRLQLDTTDIDLSSYQPATGALWALICYNTSGVFGVTVGSTVDSRADLTLANVPGSSGYDVAAVKLYEGQTGVRRDREVDDVLDLRYLGAAATIAGAGGGGGSIGTDNDAIHVNVPAEISTITEKTTPVIADIFAIEDSAASYAKKKVQLGNLPVPYGTAGRLVYTDTNGRFTGSGSPTYDTATDILTVAGLSIGQSLKFALVAASTITSNQNDYAPTGIDDIVGLILSSDAAYNITGLDGGVSSRVMYLHNQGSYDLTLTAEDASSAAANRFDFPADFILHSKESCWLFYQATSRWKLLATSRNDGASIPLDTTNFDNNLSGTDTDVQTALETLDELAGGGGGLSVDGWEAYSAVTPTRASADDPTYVLTFASVDLTGLIGVGMRLKWTQNSTVRYGIVTAISYSTNTTLTLYGGTDYDVDDTATYTISNFYYSPVKAPLGFPLDPLVWTYEVQDSTQRSQSSPAQNTWYNLGSFSIDIPIGSWLVEWKVAVQSFDTNSGAGTAQGTLSTGSSTNSDSDFQIETNVQFTGPTTENMISTVQIGKHLLLASKTTYYFNTRTRDSGLSTIYNRNDLVPAILRATCAYL